MPKKKQIRRVIKNSNQEATVGIEMTADAVIPKRPEAMTCEDLSMYLKRTPSPISSKTSSYSLINKNSINSLPRSRALSTDSLKSSSSEGSYGKQTTPDNTKSKKELSQEEKMKSFVERIKKNAGEEEIEKNKGIGKKVFSESICG